jgi:hypothetical protein
MTGDTYPRRNTGRLTKRCPLLLKPFTPGFAPNMVRALEGPAREGRASNGPA